MSNVLVQFRKLSSMWLRMGQLVSKCNEARDALISCLLGRKGLARVWVSLALEPFVFTGEGAVGEEYVWH